MRSELHRLDVLLRDPHFSDTDLFAKQKSPLHDKNFVDDGDDRDIVFLTDAGNRINLPVNRDTGYLDAVMRDTLIDLLVSRVRLDTHSYHGCFHRAARNLEDLLGKRNLNRLASYSLAVNQTGIFKVGHFSIPTPNINGLLKCHTEIRSIKQHERT